MTTLRESDGQAGPGNFDFLDGSFAVAGRRLQDPFDEDSGWTEFTATSSARLLFDGAVSIDEMWFTDGEPFGLSLRLWEPDTRTWTVRWLAPGAGLQPLVRGTWADGKCWLTGPDSYRGRDILTSYSWFDVTGAGASWAQCFSTDDGRTWQPNLTMEFTRRDATDPSPEPSRDPGDFDFFTGQWGVAHRRLDDPVAHARGEHSTVREFEGVDVGEVLLGGRVSVDEVTLAEVGQRGLSFRVRDDDGTWSIYWVNSVRGRLEPPVHGRFGDDGTGVFEGGDVVAGQPVDVRFVWSDITASSARWRQWFRVPGGEWDENWEMRFTRSAGGDA